MSKKKIHYLFRPAFINWQHFPLLQFSRLNAPYGLLHEHFETCFKKNQCVLLCKASDKSDLRFTVG